MWLTKVHTSQEAPTFISGSSSLEIDRDYNASINILRKGLEILKEEKVS